MGLRAQQLAAASRAEGDDGLDMKVMKDFMWGLKPEDIQGGQLASLFVALLKPGDALYLPMGTLFVDFVNTGGYVHQDAFACLLQGEPCRLVPPQEQHHRKSPEGCHCEFSAQRPGPHGRGRQH